MQLTTHWGTPLVSILVLLMLTALWASPALAAEEAPPEPTVEASADAPTEDAAPAEAEKEAVVTVEEETAPAYAVLDDVDTLWTCLAAFLVFFMQAGFAMVETGFTRAKNACNIIMKNLMDLSFGSMLFWLVGFGFMFGSSEWSGGWLGWGNFVFDSAVESPEVGKSVSFGWAFLIFQTVFCATAATIVSGAMAERTKFGAYLCYSMFICAVIYPVFGSWAWGSLWAGEGWLEGVGLYDFAGSTVVHSIGGWAALAGAIVIGPRIGKYSKDGKINPIPGHNIPMGALGVFILWLGWFGFNAGSTTAVGGGSFAYIAVTTNLAAASGAIGAMVVSWVAFKKPDPSLALNGALAGLVSITAGCDAMAPAFAALSGLIGGCIVVGSVVFFDKIRIDDPVGAISVHGVCGAWGTLAVGLFKMDGVGLLVGGDATQLIAQCIGVAAGFLWAFPTSLVLFLVIKYTIGLRVTEEEELAGLDITEHGLAAYPPIMVADGFHGSGLAPVVASGLAPSSAPAIQVATEGT